MNISFVTNYQLLENRKSQLGFQLFRILFLIGSAILVGIVDLIWPRFFEYPYFSWNISLMEIIAFWPLFLWGLITAFFSGSEVRSSYLDEKLFGYGLLTSVLAGTWEEIGFRCFYICLGMISITFSNWILGTFLGYLIGGLCIISSIKMFTKKEFFFCIIGILLVALGCSIIWLSSFADPVFWLYEWIIIPILHYISFGQLDSILYKGEDSQLFVMGAILANSQFRDGHKYQGYRGMLNSWVIGFVLLYVTMTYGLLTAIVIHSIYDINFSIIHYVMRKTRG